LVDRRSERVHRTGAASVAPNANAERRTTYRARMHDADLSESVDALRDAGRILDFESARDGDRRVAPRES
jgi:hypothetical protein